MDDVTGTMSKDGTDGQSGSPDDEPGLVLIYAEVTQAVADARAAQRMFDLPRAIPIGSKSVLVGRDPPGGGFAIRQTAVSRAHVALQSGKGGVVRLRDLESRNGTFVNGERVRERDLASYDVVRIGDALFSFVARGARAHLRFPLDGPITDEHGLAAGASMERLGQSLAAIATGDATVLVVGETGVGKELVARAIHARSKRAGRLVAINCAALTASLVESELFGHERGAFTGAVRPHEGLVRSAEGGTLFLDEIGDMPLDAQAKLLRVLENREVLAVGATQTVAVDVRVVCATHRDLPAMVRAGAFRGDLYARVAQRILTVPPLRERKEDLYALARQVLAPSGPPVAFGAAFMQRLALYDYPFNVRELCNALRHAQELAGKGELRATHLPDSIALSTKRAAAVVEAPQTGPQPRRKGPTPDELRELLRKERGNVAALARALDRDPGQVYRWLRQHEIDPDEYR